MYCLFTFGEIQYSIEQLNIEIKEVLVNINPQNLHWTNLHGQSLDLGGWFHYSVAQWLKSTIGWQWIFLVLGGTQWFSVAEVVVKQT